MLEKFRAYQLALRFHRNGQNLKLPPHLRDQWLRASASIALNLAEGSARGSAPDRLRFYRTALGSLRESQAILDLASVLDSELTQLGDDLGAHLYKLVKSSMP